MDTHSKQQYMDTLRARYARASKKEKGKILDEYGASSGEERKYTIKKFRNMVTVKRPEERKKRPKTYGGEVTAALAEVWRLFERSCGMRLAPILRKEVSRLRAFGELTCSDETARLLCAISPASIDRSLKLEKEAEGVRARYGGAHTEAALLTHVPVKTAADLDATRPGTTQLDCVEHCGANAAGEYVLSLTTVDIATGWWEGGAVMGKGQERTLTALKEAKARSPVPWSELHPDNGSNLLNWHIHAFAEAEGVAYSRSRPYMKNDNCWVEQKNSTHVRQEVGYLRYDTVEELEIMRELYRGPLRLYKNFFLTVMKLKEKIRHKGRVHRKYDTPATPYERLLTSGVLSEEKKAELAALYETLNPAGLKRDIERLQQKLYEAYRRKSGRPILKLEQSPLQATVSNHLIERA